MIESRLPVERLADVISWAETEFEARKKFPHAYEAEKAMYLWFYAAAVLDLRDQLSLTRSAVDSAGRQEATQWQPIETAPHDGTDILLTTWGADGYGEIDVGSWGFIEKSDWDGSDVIGWLSNYGRIEEPTHWMALPVPPENKKV
jgi:hypothetical protein